MRIRGFAGGAAALLGSAAIASTIVFPGYADTPLIITNTQVQNVTQTSATITWTTSVPTISEIDWGSSTQYGLAVRDTHHVTQHSLVLESPLLTSGITYHFITRNDDGNGTVAVGNDGTFTVPGTQLEVKVVGSSSNQPISGAAVSWNDVTAITDSTGQATLASLPSGNETIVVRYNGITIAQLAQVSPPTTGQAQNVSITFDASSAAGVNPLLAGMTALVLFGLGILAAKHTERLRGTLRRAHRTRQPTQQSAEAPRATPHVAIPTDPDTSSSTKLGMSVSELHSRFFKRDDTE